MDFVKEGGLSKSVVQDYAQERKRVTLVTFAVLSAAASYIVMLFIAMPLSIHIIKNKEESCDLETDDACFAPTDDSQRYLTIVLSLLRAMTFLFGSFVGTVSDKFGRRPLMIGALFGYTTAGILFLLGWTTETLPLFILGGMILGASSPVTPHGVAYISDISHPDRLAVNMGVLQGFGYFLGLMAGALLALAISEATTGQEEDPTEAAVEPYNRLFYGAYGTGIGLSACAALITLFFLPESLHEDERVDQISVKKANPFGFVALISRNGYLFFIWLSAFCGWASVGASESVTGGWWLRRYTQTNVNDFIIFIVALWVSSGFGAVIMTKMYVSLRGLKFAIHASMWFSVATGVAFALAPSVSTSYIAVGLSFFASAVVPTTVALLMGQVPANEKGALAGALRSSEALAKLIGILIFSSLFANYIEEFRPDQSCVPPLYGLIEDDSNTCDCGVETCPTFDPDDLSGLVINATAFPFYYQPEICSFGQLSPTFHGKYGKFIPWVDPEPRPIVPQVLVDQGIVPRDETCQGGGRRGRSITLELDRQWCVTLSTDLVPSQTWEEEFGCPGFNFAAFAFTGALIENVGFCANATDTRCDPDEVTRLTAGVPGVNSTANPGGLFWYGGTWVFTGIPATPLAPTNAAEFAEAKTYFDRIAADADPEDVCTDEFGSAEMNLCWNEVIADFPGLFPLLYLACLPALSYVFFLIAEILFGSKDQKYWTTRDELTELEDPANGKISP